IFEMEATRQSVSGVARLPLAMSASPSPAVQRSPSRFAMTTPIPGVWVSFRILARPDRLRGAAGPSAAGIAGGRSGDGADAGRRRRAGDPLDRLRSVTSLGTPEEASRGEAGVI